MKMLLGTDFLANYSFAPLAKTITITNIGATFSNLNFLVIVNATSNKVLYALGDPTNTLTVTGNVVTLSYDTTSMNSGDVLQIFMTFGDNTRQELYTLLNRALALVSSSATVTVNGQQQLIADTSPGSYAVTNDKGFGPSILQTTMVQDPTQPIGTYPIYSPNPDPDDPGNTRNNYVVDSYGYVFPADYAFVTQAVQHMSISRGPVDQRWEIMIDSQTDASMALRNKLDWG